MADAVVLVAEGSEEIETITPGDVLVRSGVDVTYAGVGSVTLRGSRGLPLGADVEVGAIGGRLFDAVVVPGGGAGARALAASGEVSRILRAHAEAGRVVAAICAAPAVVLAPLGLLDGRRATCYPGLEERFGETTVFVGDGVVEDGDVITSRGPATALAFSLAVAGRLAGAETAERVAREMLVAR